MTIDLKQFHQVFIEESVEGLEAMELGLMELNVDCVDTEIINTIFRSAHSIKGGAGTFGFSALASFTHVLETLLDEVRSGVRVITPEIVNLLLNSIDCMREMLEIIQNERNEYTPKATHIQTALEDILQAKTEPAASANNLIDSDFSSTKSCKKNNVWEIIFNPHRNIMRVGNDPLRLIKELVACADEFTIELLGSTLSFNEYCVEDCYLGWKILLHGEELGEAQILNVFEWVIDDCELSVKSQHAYLAHTAQVERWKIHFSPYPHLFQTGNDVLRIFTELKRVCTIDSCLINYKRLPPLNLIDVEQCYLVWDLEVSDVLDKTQLDSVFEWVTSDSDIIIELCSASVASQAEHHPSSIDSKSKDIKSPAQMPLISKQKHSANNLLEHAAAMSTPDNDSAILSSVGSSPLNSLTESEKNNTNKKKSQVNEASSIRVGTDKIDSLINMVGELVITQSMLGQLGADFTMQSLPRLIEGLNQLEQNTRELQESVMRIRMLPISFAFSRFPRMVRDLGQTLNKKINLVLLGETTELDKTVMEKIGDPLVHLVRNSVDHGIETADERLAIGKPEEGTVTLNAYHQGGNVVIEIIDDGKGLDRKRIAEKGVERGLIQAADVDNLTDEHIFDLIFQPGFSTAQQVSDLSGRGVGMDVVKRNIQALNGVVEIQSKKGVGTKIRISLPLTLAILDGQLVRVGSDTYIFPLVSIVESMQYREDLVNHIAGGCSVFRLREEYVPIVNLGLAFGQVQSADREKSLMVVVESDGYKVAMLVDELMAQQQVVIKSLEQNYKRVEGISGATILGDGTVALIIDVPGVVRLVGEDQTEIPHALRKKA